MKKFFILIFAFAFTVALAQDTLLPGTGDSSPIIPKEVSGLPLIITILLGFITYMALNYRDMKLKTPHILFSWKVWLKENWYNMAAFTGYIGYQYLTGNLGTMNTQIAFLVGMAPNKIIDTVGGFIEKWIVGKAKYEAPRVNK
jgi:hypothetical protein